MKAENIIKPEYKHFNKALSLKQLYKPPYLAKSRGLLCSKTLEGIFLALSFPIKMFWMVFGGFNGISLPLNGDFNILKIPKFSCNFSSE